jgi:dipeptide transport system permease protein
MRSSNWLETWRALRASPAALPGLALVALVLVAAAGAGVLAPHSPIAQEQGAILRPPAWLAGGSWATPLGTDGVGRDLLSRLLYGARLSLGVGVQSVTLSLLVGTALGLLAGYWRGWVDALLMRAVDIMLALPSLLLAIAIVAVLEPSLRNAVVAIAVVNVPIYLRLARAAVLAEMPRDYVTAARVAGAGPLHLMLRTLLPNCASPLIVQAALGFSGAVLDAAALGYLGLGAQPPSPEWGTMLADAMQFMQRAWWVVTFPGLAILLTVLGFNLLGDALRDALDPRLRSDAAPAPPFGAGGDAAGALR